MSRQTFYEDDRLTVVKGVDHMLGDFIQMYDNHITDDPSGEGIVLDWSKEYGYEANLTGLPKTEDPMEIVQQYIAEHGEEKNNFNNCAQI